MSSDNLSKKCSLKLELIRQACKILSFSYRSIFLDKVKISSEYAQESPSFGTGR